MTTCEGDGWLKLLRKAEPTELLSPEERIETLDKNEISYMRWRVR